MSEEANDNTAPSEDQLLDQKSPNEDPEGGHTSEGQGSPVAELEKVLAKTDLAGAKGQTKRGAGIDSLTTKDVKKLTESYKADIESLKEKLKCLSTDDGALRIAQENQKLKKQNEILRGTNMDFVNKYLALSRQLEDTEKERDKLKAAISSLQMSAKCGPSRCHPGGDVGATVGTEPRKEALQASEEVEQLKACLSDYATMQQKSAHEKLQLSHDLRQLQLHLADKEVQFKKVMAQLQNVVQERDKYHDAFIKMSHRGAQEASNMNSNVQWQEDIPNQHKHLLVELTEKNRKLEEQLKYKDDHIVEQENKIEKLTLRCAEAEKNAKIRGNAHQRSTALASGNEVPHRINEDNEAKIRGLEQRLVEYDQRHIAMTCELEKMKNIKNPDAFLYNEQLKAFQEDYIAEREEKQRIIEESRRLHEDNQHLRQELQSRATSQGHFASPAPNTNTAFESMPPRTPPISHGLQQPDLSGHMHSQMPHQVSPPHGPLANSGYHPNYPHEYRRANTIPPRNASGQPLQHYGYHPDEQFYPMPLQNHPVETAHEAGHGYQGTAYCNPSSSGPRPTRPPSSGPSQVWPPQDGRAPR